MWRHSNSLDLDDLREVVRVASDRHEDVAQAVRQLAGRAAGDFQQLRAEIDGGLGTRRFLDYRESSGWAMQAAPVVAEIRPAVVASSSATLVPLVERAVGHVVKVIAHADDSDGVIGDLARELLDLHAEACDAGVADPVKLAQWMVRFCCEDQDFFEVDPVRYADALEEPGLAWYRGEIGRRRDRGGSSFAVRYAEERLAVLDGDTDAIVALLGGDLSSPYQFVRVATAMVELGRDDDVLAWAIEHCGGMRSLVWVDSDNEHGVLLGRLADELPTLRFTSKAVWRRWLAANHSSSSGIRIGQALGLRHSDFVSRSRELHIVPRTDNANGARAKVTATTVVPVSVPLVRLYSEYMYAEYGELDSD